MFEREAQRKELKCGSQPLHFSMKWTSTVREGDEQSRNYLRCLCDMIQENDTTNCCSTSFLRHSFKVSGFQTSTLEMSFDSSQNPPGVLALTDIDVHSANVFFSHSYQPTGPFRWVLLYTNTSTCVCVLFHCEGVLTHFCISPFIHPSVKTSVFHLSLSILISSFLSSQHQS